MIIKGSVAVELDWEQEQEVIVQILKKDYMSLQTDTVALRNKFSSLEDYEKEDYFNNIKTLKAIEGVLEHYMPYSEHKEWMNANHPALKEPLDE